MIWILDQMIPSATVQRTQTQEDCLDSQSVVLPSRGTLTGWRKGDNRNLMELQKSIALYHATGTDSHGWLEKRGWISKCPFQSQTFCPMITSTCIFNYHYFLLVFHALQRGLESVVFKGKDINLGLFPSHSSFCSSIQKKKNLQRKRETIMCCTWAAHKKCYSSSVRNSVRCIISLMKDEKRAKYL